MTRLRANCFNFSSFRIQSVAMAAVATSTVTSRGSCSVDSVDTVDSVDIVDIVCRYLVTWPWWRSMAVTMMPLATPTTVASTRLMKPVPRETSSWPSSESSHTS